MIVLVLESVPSGLRGLVTRWLVEIAPGVYVGKLSARVREHLWDRVTRHADSGRAIMVFSANNEQGYAFLVHQHKWIPVTVEGVVLMARPKPQVRKPQGVD